MTGSRRAVAAGLLALLVAGCGSTTPTQPPIPGATPALEALPTPGADAPDARLTCGGLRTFPASALEAPAGAETQAGVEFDALRAALARFGSEFIGSAGLTWQLAQRDATGAIFLARAGVTDGIPDWLSVEVEGGSAGWQPVGMGACTPLVVLSDEFGPATWALDPAFPAPIDETTQLRVLVSERACASGSPTTGRMSAPVVVVSAATVTVTIGVRPLGGIQTCPLPPGTPAIVTLPEPLGNRALLDGGRVPPAPPSAP
ncbi:MAG TPA: hypothetical protein VER83_08190 [Candidatus Nanopelagicales bacterium]|nr:hypothetical protein [Candidatus Nanopelagicales bacterium]